MVPSNSPAFAAVDDLYLRSSRQETLENLNFVLHQLQRIFKSRTALLYDVDLDGNTLLHVDLSHI